MKPVLLVYWLLQCVYCVAGVPVLPQPQQCSIGETAFHFNPYVIFKSKTADTATVGRLQRHWSDFSSDFNEVVKTQPSVYSLILLGTNSKEEATLNKLLSGSYLSATIGDEGYILVVNDSVKIIAANTETGLFYGLQSLRQLTRAKFNRSVLITDWPQFKHRVVMDDISRGPISTVDFIKYQIRRMAEIKINYLTFYIEHVIQTVSHPDIAPANGKLTIKDIRELSAYAASYHMQLIGSFQSFGHFEKILSLPAYRDMGATSNLIDPDNPKAKQFLSDVIGEMCDAFSAPWFNVNCDETFDLGKGSSKAGVDSLGIAAYYAKHIRFLNSIVQKHKKKLMLWGDIAIQHEEILDMLPKDLIWLTWEYGTPDSFDKWIHPFSKRGLPFMVCPGILNSNRLFPDLEMAVKNISSFAKAGAESGSLGVFTTIWDDGGASFFSNDWYGVYKAAEKSWNLYPETDKDFDHRYCINVFNDEKGAYTKALHQFLELRKLPLTWNMTDQLWYQSSLPAAGRKILFCNADMESAQEICEKVLKILPLKASGNNTELLALHLAVNQYKSLFQWRRSLPFYTKTIQAIKSKSPIEKSRLLKESMISGWFNYQRALDEKYRNLYSEIWNAENQPYWLDIALSTFDEKIKAADQVVHELQKKQNMSNSNPANTGSRLSEFETYETQDRYFQNWLFCGPFKGSLNQAPSFNYFPENTTAKPKPGDQFNYEGNSFRWKKFASPAGGITYLQDQWPTALADASWVYGFATIQSDSIRTLPAFLLAGKNAVVYCNDQQVSLKSKQSNGLSFLSAVEWQMQLQLTKGINYLLIKLPGNIPDKAFAFRLHPSVTIANHKHKYYLNPNTSDHEAE